MSQGVENRGSLFSFLPVALRDQSEAQVGDVLILACDGVFDVFSNERVVKEVDAMRQQKPSSRFWDGEEGFW